MVCKNDIEHAKTRAMMDGERLLFLVRWHELGSLASQSRTKKIMDSHAVFELRRRIEYAIEHRLSESWRSTHSHHPGIDEFGLDKP